MAGFTLDSSLGEFVLSHPSLLHDGRLVGIHLSVVNDLKLLMKQDMSVEERTVELASSVNSLIEGASTGCVALLASAFPAVHRRRGVARG